MSEDKILTNLGVYKVGLRSFPCISSNSRRSFSILVKTRNSLHLGVENSNLRRVYQQNQGLLPLESIPGVQIIIFLILCAYTLRKLNICHVKKDSSLHSTQQPKQLLVEGTPRYHFNTTATHIIFNCLATSTIIFPMQDTPLFKPYSHS